MLPDTRYARRGGLHLAYQVLGSGPRDILLAEAREILVSSTVKDLVVGSGLEFEDRGSHELKGVPGDWRVYAVRG